MKAATSLAAAVTVMAAACLPTMSAQAAGLGLRAGTMGVGGDLSFALAPSVSVRLGVSGLNYNTTVDKTEVRYDGKLKLSNVSALLDWNVAGPFRLTAGLVGGGSKIDVTGTPTGGQYTLNGTTYNAADVGTLTGDVKPGRSTAPYLGIGFGNVARKGLGFYADLGVIFQGSPKARLSATCDAATPPALCTQIQTDLLQEQQRLQDDLNSFKYYPVANVGVSYGF